MTRIGVLVHQNRHGRALAAPLADDLRGKAVAAEGCVAAPTSGDFLARHGFKSHSTVRSALADLIGSDLLYQTDRGYVVYDRLFGIWLSRNCN